MKHFLFLNNKQENKEKIRKLLLDVKEKFDNSKLLIKINSVTFLEKKNFNAFDSRFGSKLNSKNEYEYCLIMDFEDVKDLNFFYGSTESSEYRELIYKIINPTIIQNFEALLKFESESDKINQMIQIEKIMQKYISRMDFVVNDPTEEIVDFLIK